MRFHKGLACLFFWCFLWRGICEDVRKLERKKFNRTNTQSKNKSKNKSKRKNKNKSKIKHEQKWVIPSSKKKNIYPKSENQKWGDTKAFFFCELFALFATLFRLNRKLFNNNSTNYQKKKKKSGGASFCLKFVPKRELKVRVNWNQMFIVSKFSVVCLFDLFRFLFGWLLFSFEKKRSQWSSIKYFGLGFEVDRGFLMWIFAYLCCNWSSLCLLLACFGGKILFLHFHDIASPFLFWFGNLLFIFGFVSNFEDDWWSVVILNCLDDVSFGYLSVVVLLFFSCERKKGVKFQFLLLHVWQLKTCCMLQKRRQLRHLRLPQLNENLWVFNISMTKV